MDENKTDNSGGAAGNNPGGGATGNNPGPGASSGGSAESTRTSGQPDPPISGSIRSRGGHGRLWTGLFLLVIGGALLLDQMGFPFPDWLFNWHTLLIIIGLFLGFRSNFRGAAWLILILIGSFYLARDSYPDLPVERYVWPCVMIGVGLLFILRPHHRSWSEGGRWRNSPGWEERFRGRWKDRSDRWKDRGDKWKDRDWRRDQGQSESMNWSQAKTSGTSADFLDSTAIFGGSHKKIVTKTFRGGDCTSIMGGTEIDLSQADINGTVILDVTQIMGGTKIIVPAHWEVRCHVTAVFAGFEDKRLQPVAINPDKVLILEGTSIFGGIELRNF